MPHLFTEYLYRGRYSTVSMALTNRDAVLFTIGCRDNSLKLSRIHKYLFLAENGGLSDDPIEPASFDPGFNWEKTIYGPHSSEVDTILKTVSEESVIQGNLYDGMVDIDDRYIPDEYSYLSRPVDALPSNPTNLPHELKVILSVRKLYDRLALLSLIDSVEYEYDEYYATPGSWFDSTNI